LLFKISFSFTAHAHPCARSTCPSWTALRFHL